MEVGPSSCQHTLILSTPQTRVPTSSEKFRDQIDVLVNSTPHRAHSTRATHAFFRVHSVQDVSVLLRLVFLECHSISSMFSGRLLDAPFSSPFPSPFPTLAHSSMTTNSPLCTSQVQPLCKEGCSLAALLNSPLGQVMSPSLSLKSAASTSDELTLEKGVSARTSTILRPWWTHPMRPTRQKWDS